MPLSRWQSGTLMYLTRAGPCEDHVPDAWRHPVKGFHIKKINVTFFAEIDFSAFSQDWQKTTSMYQSDSRADINSRSLITTDACLSSLPWFVLCKPLLLCFLSACPQKRGLPTLRESKSDWKLHSPAHTHSRRGPNGAGNRKWSNSPQPVSELWFIHTRVTGNRCGKRIWKNKNEKKGGKQEGRQLSNLCWHRYSLRERTTWTHCHLSPPFGQSKSVCL